MVVRIAYFSWKGHTQKVATALAERVDAELVRDRTAQRVQHSNWRDEGIHVREISHQTMQNRSFRD